jgi:hypothetical protein
MHVGYYRLFADVCPCRLLSSVFVFEMKPIDRFLLNRTPVCRGDQERKGYIAEAALHGYGIDRLTGSLNIVKGERAAGMKTQRQPEQAGSHGQSPALHSHSTIVEEHKTRKI